MNGERGSAETCGGFLRFPLCVRTTRRRPSSHHVPVTFTFTTSTNQGAFSFRLMIRGDSMDDPCRYAHRPVAFLARNIARRPLCHAVILAAVLAAVGCSVSAQYGVKILVDTLSGATPANGAWVAFALLGSLIVADNLLWRLASWIAGYTFPGVARDLRCDF